MLLLAFFGDVTGKSAHAHDLVTLHDRIEGTIKVERPAARFQPNTNQTGPAAFLEKPGQTAIHVFPFWFVQKLFSPMADNLAVRNAEQFGYAPVYSFDLPIQGSGE